MVCVQYLVGQRCNWSPLQRNYDPEKDFIDDTSAPSKVGKTKNQENKNK